MLEDQLLLIVVFQKNGVFIERANPARKLDATYEVDRDWTLVFANSIQERILNVLCRLGIHVADLLIHYLSYMSPCQQL